jgi:hypothetical protein
MRLALAAIVATVTGVFVWGTGCGGGGGGGDGPSPIDAAPAVDAFGPRADARLAIDARPVVDAAIPDAGVDANPLVLECQVLRRQWAGVVAGLATGCATPADCVVLGKNDDATCEAAPMLASRCDGDAVNQAAYATVAAQLDPIAADFAARCTGAALCPANDLGCAGRCSPQVEVSCVHAVCSPFTPPCVAPDAGP